jgi:DDE superfamily endonuclease
LPGATRLDYERSAVGRIYASASASPGSRAFASTDAIGFTVSVATASNCTRWKRRIDRRRVRVGAGSSVSLSRINCAVGAHMIFLPPYSPDLNPIEQVFAKLKHILRTMARRTVEDTWRGIAQALNAFEPEECARYLTNAGYASS